MRAWGMLIVVSCAGCGGAAPPPSQFPTADDALGRMHACYDCALGVRASVKVDNLSPEGRIKGSVEFTAVVPDKISFSAAIAEVTVLRLTSDGTDFKLFDYKKHEFLYGPAKPCNIARLTEVPIPGASLVDLLRGEAPVLAHDSASITWDSGGYYVLHIPSKHDAEEEIHLEVHPDDLQKPWKEQRVRVKYVRVAQKGIDLYDIDLDDFRPEHTAPTFVDTAGIDPDTPPIGPSCDAELPHAIRMKVPHTREDVKFTYKETITGKGPPIPPMWNPPLLDQGTFTQPVPGGVRVVAADCD
jgi:hypothetical protein